MGQYHSIVNLDRRSGYSAASLGGFIKLMEQAHSAVSTSALMLLLADAWQGEHVAIVGDYAVDEDLPQSSEMIGYRASEIWGAIEAKGGGIKNVGWLPRKILADEGIAKLKRHDYVATLTHWSEGPNGNLVTHKTELPGHKYELTELNILSDEPGDEDIVVVNLDKGQKIDPKLLGDAGTLMATATDCSHGGTGTALFVLLGVSGGHGGGDFRLDHELVGSWVGDRIAVIPRSEVEDAPKDITVKIRMMLEQAKEGRYQINLDGSVQRLPLYWEK